MGKPAARIGDWHNCPRVSPNGIPHAGGQIVGPGCLTVLIEGQPAATKGDACLCVGDLDKIKSGSTGVYIEGKPAARQGDGCAHGGVVIGGSGTVFIGEKMGIMLLPKSSSSIDEEKFTEPSEEEKRRATNQAIKDCTALLEKKLALLERNDPQTLENFKKWFGRDDQEAKGIILEMMRKALEVSKGLTVENFKDRSNEQKDENMFAEVYHCDKAHTIFVNELFWKAKQTGQDSKAAIVVHELSHFEDVGNTKDFVYKTLCLELANVHPIDALKNAANFECFVVS
jgi:uncharacterized Zn-binding protein involved in type VI secretion